MRAAFILARLGSPRRRWALAGLASLGLAGAVLALASSMGRIEKPEERSEAPALRVAQVRSSTEADELLAFGSLAFPAKLDIVAPEEGELLEAPPREGARVEAGQVVARLRNPQLELALRRAQDGIALAEASLALAEARLFEGRLGAEARLLGLDRSALELEKARREFLEAERRQSDQETLFEAGGVTEESVRAGRLALAAASTARDMLELDVASRSLGLRDDALRARGLAVPTDESERRAALCGLATEALAAERAAAAARLAAARNEAAMTLSSLESLVVTSSRAGAVAARMVERGERVARGDRLVTIIDEGSLDALVQVGEADSPRLALGQAARVSVSATGREYAGLVQALAPLADSRSGSLSVRITLASADSALRPGMFARAALEAGPPRPFLLVPREAVRIAEGEPGSDGVRRGQAFAVVAGRASERSLRLGEDRPGEIVVLAGLSEGEVVIVRPETGLKEGDDVRIQR